MTSNYFHARSHAANSVEHKCHARREDGHENERDYGAHDEQYFAIRAIDEHFTIGRYEIIDGDFRFGHLAHLQIGLETTG